MARLTVVIPSRLGSRQGNGTQEHFLARAIRSIRAQKLDGGMAIEILAGIDAGARIPAALAGTRVRFVEAAGRSQAAALNAAAREMSADYLAILEDDDEWQPQFLELSLAALRQADFVSSTQLEVTAKGEVVRIMDFPTPSGWVMKRATWQAVGEFNESFRWHVDNEWLGRLAETGLPRMHLVEATAPVSLRAATLARPELVRLVRDGGGSVRLLRHASPWPLVRKLAHPGSGMAQIAAEAGKKSESRKELALLKQRFGRIPW